MPFVTDSRFAGYLRPNDPASPGPPPNGPLTDDAWDDFLHDIIAGITGLDPTMVRPRWQQEPVLRPDIDDDWVGFGVMNTTVDFAPVFIHVGDGNNGNGYDALQQMEEHTILCSFYGPNSERYVSYLQRGLWVDQHHATMRAQAVGLVSVGGMTRTSELVKQRWWPRSDVSFVLRREVRYDYNVFNLLRAKGQLTANPPGEQRLVSDDFDTGYVTPPGPIPGTTWDGNTTKWDNGDTIWDAQAPPP